MRELKYALLTRAATAWIVCMACAVLGGCFSMSAVPPAEGLSQVETPNAHAAAAIDPAANPEAESDWGKDATFVLLHPTVNGRDVGWFILDSGASGCTITADAAAKAGMPAIGSTRLQGETRTTVFRCDELRLGPLTLSGLNVTGINISRSSQAFGRHVVGILGRNVFSGAIVELDGPNRAVRLRGTDALAGAGGLAWHPIEMKRNLPHVRCEYAHVGEGVFVVDTGADSAVHFFQSPVERHSLKTAPGVRITGGKTQITLGTIGRIAEGTIDDFRMEEQQCGPTVATFAGTGDGPSKVLPDIDGLIGMGLMRGFTVYIDEPKGRLAFVAPPRAGE